MDQSWMDHESITPPPTSLSPAGWSYWYLRYCKPVVPSSGPRAPFFWSLGLIAVALARPQSLPIERCCAAEHRLGKITLHKVGPTSVAAESLPGIATYRILDQRNLQSFDPGSAPTAGLLVAQLVRLIMQPFSLSNWMQLECCPPQNHSPYIWVPQHLCTSFAWVAMDPLASGLGA